MFVGVVLEVVLFGGDGEAADREVGDLGRWMRTRSWTELSARFHQPSRQL